MRSFSDAENENLEGNSILRFVEFWRVVPVRRRRRLCPALLVASTSLSLLTAAAASSIPSLVAAALPLVASPTACGVATARGHFGGITAFRRRNFPSAQIDEVFPVILAATKVERYFHLLARLEVVQQADFVLYELQLYVLRKALVRKGDYKFPLGESFAKGGRGKDNFDRAVKLVRHARVRCECVGIFSNQS